MRMSIINLLYVLYIKLVNEISPFENNPKKVWLYYKKKGKINFFPPAFQSFNYNNYTTNPNQRNKSKKIMKCDLQFAILSKNKTNKILIKQCSFIQMEKISSF